MSFPADTIEQAFTLAFSLHINADGHNSYETAILEAHNREIDQQKKLENALDDLQRRWQILYNDLYGPKMDPNLSDMRRDKVIAPDLNPGLMKKKVFFASWLLARLVEMSS